MIRVSWWHRCSIRARLALLASAVMALLCSALAVFIVLVARQAAIDHRTEQLFALAVEMGIQARQQIPDLTQGSPVRAVQVFNPAGDMAAATPEMADKPPMTNLRPDPDAFASARTCDTQAFPGRCMIVLAYPFHRSDGVWQIDMAVPDVPWYVGPELLIPLAVGWLLLVAATAAGSYRIVGKTLEPVGVIAGNLAQITASDLDHRVPVPRYRDELRDLAETANRTLDRAQSAVEQQLRFASEASHDLRSPLTAIRIHIEEALMDPRQANWPQVANAVLESVERMQHLVCDLLQAARLDAGVTGRRERLDLTELVRRELDQRPARVYLRRRLAAGVIVEGDRLDLARLLNNLLDNAERHAESIITVLLTLEDGEAVLEVSDDGEGVPPEQREMIFQRFARLEASRVKDAGGTGLGLPIARQIAHAHNGTLTLEDSPRGARFAFRLPGYTTRNANHPQGKKVRRSQPH
ncbi:sensor histidine kinase [Nonomuraea sp. NPDC049400]|uniref:sensor histidine kinase n=1 Tax=Nonomuraea sp. NPDC049400 TaxID=3364352 RepID=UPI0037AA238A